MKMKTKSVILVFFIFLLISCDALKKEEDPKKYYAIFTVDGVQKKYSSEEDNGFYNSTTEYINSWHEKEDHSGDSVYMELPVTLSSGVTYNESSSNFTVGLDYNGTWYFTDSSHAFTLTVTKWGSIGEVVSGTFSGTVAGGGNTKVITNGTFEATNNTDETP